MGPSMPAVVHYALREGGVELREVPVPAPTEGEVLVRVAAVGVCGSDVHTYHNTQSWPANVPVVLGHEFCGEIAALGPGVKRFREGDQVVSETAAEIDEDSPQARAGLYNLDPHRRGFGNARDGGMASYVRVPARCLHIMPQGLETEVAAYTEPCCVAYNAVVGNARVRPGDVVVVIGPGPIGLLCAQMARLCGAGAVVVAGIARDRPRLALALRSGATHTLELGAGEPMELLRTIGDGCGADVVIDAAGASSALEENLDHPLGPMLYGVSTLHCMTVSLALDGEGLGTAWGEQKARELLREAGFADPDVRQVEGDIINSYYVTRLAG